MKQEIEIWKDVAGFEGHYSISSHGRVMSHKNKKGVANRIMSTCNDKQGYQLVKLCDNGKIVIAKVHRLVGYAFVENPCYATGLKRVTSYYIGKLKKSA